MSSKVLRSKLKITGIAPNLLLKDVEVTAPFLFKGDIAVDGKQREYLSKLVFYKKNLNALKYLNLGEYFFLCMSAHWATAGTYVPTNVDNQIREGLWKHKDFPGSAERMAQITLDSWSWNYEQVTNRKTMSPDGESVLSTHEGTWLSVAIGAYNALKKSKRESLAKQVAEALLSEIEKEEKILSSFRHQRDHLNFLRTSALMAHNLGDLDRVIDQWQMPEEDSFRQRIYKLGHQMNSNYSNVLAFAGSVNKHFLAVENHRHMSLRRAKCLRKSSAFLVPLGPFMDDWGRELAVTSNLSDAEKAEIVSSLFEGFKRQDHAFGYARAFGGMLEGLPAGLSTLERELPFDLVAEINKSPFFQIAKKSKEEFHEEFKKKLDDFICPVTGEKF